MYGTGRCIVEDGRATFAPEDNMGLEPVCDDGNVVNGTKLRFKDRTLLWAELGAQHYRYHRRSNIHIARYGKYGGGTCLSPDPANDRPARRTGTV